MKFASSLFIVAAFASAIALPASAAPKEKELKLSNPMIAAAKTDKAKPAIAVAKPGAKPAVVKTGAKTKAAKKSKKDKGALGAASKKKTT